MGDLRRPVLRRRTAAAAALVLLTALAACSGAGSGKGAEGGAPTGTAAMGGAAEPDTPQPAPPVVAQRVFPDPAPRGEERLELVALSEMSALQRRARAAGDLDVLARGTAVVITEDLVITAALTPVVTAVDREDGTVVWEHAWPRDRGEVQPLCRLVRAAPDAEVLFLLVGVGCGEWQALDLATGEVLEEGLFGTSEQFPNSSGSATVGPSTFVASTEDGGFSIDTTIWRIGPDGVPERALGASAFGLASEETVVDLAATAGGELLVVVSTDRRQDGPLDARFRGLVVESDGSLTPDWEMTEREALASAVPARRTLPGLTGNLLYRVDSLETGLGFYTSVEGPPRTPRFSAPDPTTGLLTRGLALPTDPPGAFPMWAREPTSARQATTLLVDDQLFGTAGPSTSRENLVRYDLAAQRIAWVWSPGAEGPRSSGPPGTAISIVGLTDDGARVLAAVTTEEATRVVQLDAATGAEVASWSLPPGVESEFGIAQFYVEGTDLVWVNTSSSDDRGPFVAVAEFVPAAG